MKSPAQFNDIIVQLARQTLPLPAALMMVVAALTSERIWLTLGLLVGLSGLHIAASWWSGAEKQHTIDRLQLCIALLLLPPVAWSTGAAATGWLPALPLLLFVNFSLPARQSAAFTALMAALLVSASWLGGVHSPAALVLIGAVIASTGITTAPLAQALRRQWQEHESALLRAQKTTKAKTTFLANASHELRTPIMGVLGTNALLLETALTPDQRHLAQVMQHSGQSLLEVINAVLDLSRIEADALELERIRFELIELIHSAATATRALVVNKDLELRLELPEEPCWVIGDPTRLRQVLLNLLSNAVKFTAQGHISLCARWEDGLATFSVSDTGMGIPPEKQALIFQPFTQADTSTTRAFGGTGLGLTVVRELVELMGGTVSLESQLGEGSTFRFTAQLPPTSAPAFPVVSMEHTTRLARILLVEDHPINQMITTRMLEAEGHTVRLACDGEEALSALQEERFDLVLMDCQMPVMDGLEATRRLRMLPPPISRTPVVALTASAMQDDQERCAAAGMDDFLSKPFEVGGLRRVIGRNLRSKCAV